MSGQFTIGTPEGHTGKANMIAVKCDLCNTEVLFDPEKVNANNQIYAIAVEHVCKKPIKVRKKRRVFRFPRPKIMEYILGGRRERLGPPEPEEDDATV